MSNQSEAQRLSTVRKLTGELYALQDRMNQTIEQITLLLRGDAVARAIETGSPVPAGGGVERTRLPVALSAPLPDVFVNNPVSGHALGEDCRLYSDYRGGQLQVVQIPSARAGEARFGLNVNYANFDGTWLSLVFDARSLLQDMPAGKARLAIALETTSDPVVKLTAKIGFKVGGIVGEHILTPRGGRVLVDAFDIPELDPAKVEQLEFHLVFTPQTRGCIELHRAVFSASVVASEDIATAAVFEGGV